MKTSILILMGILSSAQAMAANYKCTYRLGDQEYPADNKPRGSNFGTISVAAVEAIDLKDSLILSIRTHGYPGLPDVNVKATSPIPTEGHIASVSIALPTETRLSYWVTIQCKFSRL